MVQLGKLNLNEPKETTKKLGTEHEYDEIGQKYNK
jgi:hypothetical protein